ncbi:gliding motility lipoprotein GldH [Mongoliitalea lutea]|uniref:Gliding motility-associated lipoprotein GldH n=1 Tax=Mongoliitalea lutea TaxID=849756 RepID=A0A8J3CYS4_9BACT|nr:gliding motility lipoprotein GldH [Mongoliitalea lutea]GHB43463.1 hypothetical protein GCM10008106_25550 [Mongoliitalea lutea]
MAGNRLAYSLIGIIVSILVLSACGTDRLFEDYQGMPSLKWSIEDTVRFELNPAAHHGKMLIAVKHTDAYEFRNLYVRYILRDSSNQILENTLVNIPLFERTSGSPLGKGFGGTFTKYDTLPVSVDSKIATVQFIQYMRTETLNGIEAIGLKVVKHAAN